MIRDLDKNIIVMGAGGHAKVITDALKVLGYRITGITIPDAQPGNNVFDCEVLGDDVVIKRYNVKDTRLVNGLGSTPEENQHLRWQKAKQMREQGYTFLTVVHPKAIISVGVTLAEGVQVMAGSIIQSGVAVGQDSIINTGVIIDHDCTIGKDCHLAPGVVCSGGVNVEDGVHIGTGSSVIQNIEIGSNAIIASGSVIYRDVLENQKVIQVRDQKKLEKY